MHDELKALAKLAKMDGAAADQEAELRDVPARIDGMRSDLDTLETMLAAERGQLEGATALRDERAADLKSKLDALSLAKTKLSKSRTLREADNAEREVEHIRRAIKEREEEVLSIEETIEQKAASLSERESQFEDARKILRDEESASKERLVEVRASRDKVLAGRDKVVAQVPKRVVKRYEKLRTRPRYEAVSIIGADGTCYSCRMALPPQLFINVQRGEEFHECPQCRAFLVHEAFTPDFIPPSADESDA